MLGMESRPWHLMWNEINEQAAEFPGSVECLRLCDNGERTSGQKRQELSRQATGDYVCWVDDDDLVSPDYVTRILTGCLTGVDVVGITLQMFKDYVPGEVWHFGLYPDQRSRGLMAANHLCAWKREIAERVCWTPELGYGDDQAWYGPLHAAGLAKTGVTIQEPIYRYLFSSGDTANQQKSVMDASRRYWGVGLGCYRDSAGVIYIQRGDKRWVARGPNLEEVPILPNTLTRFATLKLK